MPNRRSDPPPFEIKADVDTGIVTTVLRGFWTLATLDGFAAGMADAIGKVAPHHPVFALLSDSTEFQIQTPAVGARFAEMMTAGAAMHLGPTAIVVGTVLNKLQAERLFTDPRVRVFTDAGEARRWIDAYREAPPREPEEGEER
jgi:hypothetical protein